MSAVDAAVEAVVETLREPLQRLRDASNVPVPSEELVVRAVRGCVTRNGWRKTKPSGEEAAVLWSLVKFHRSGGSLYGWPWFADESLRDQLDTLAIVMLGGSRASEAWQRAMS